MVFNELSAKAQAADSASARKRMSIFIATTVLATGNFGVKRVLRIEKEFFDILLAPEYPLNRWLNDNQADREEKRRLSSLVTKYPPLSGFEETEIEYKYMLYKFRYNSQPAHGLGIAYLLDALALSFDSDSQWNESRISIQMPETVMVYHACRPEHVRKNESWIKEQLQKNDPYLKYGLPKTGKYPYVPPKYYDFQKSPDFPTKIHGNQKAFIDDRDHFWLWDKQEKHWDVQFRPYGRDNYFRVSTDGKLLDA